jgi:16S rRNA G527 N7-methylase RsmG
MSEFSRLLSSCWPSLSPEQIALLANHYDLLTRWNRRLNLTSVANLHEMIRLHYFESLFLGAQLPRGPLSILDAGSGAGFPGIPIAVLRPECSVTLSESRSRKAVFLREATRELSNVSVFSGRAEDWKGAVDWVVARAVPHSSLDWAPNLAWLGSAGEGSWDRSVAIPGTIRRCAHFRNVPRGTSGWDVPRGT